MFTDVCLTGLFGEVCFFVFLLCLFGEVVYYRGVLGCCVGLVAFVTGLLIAFGGFMFGF